MNKQTTQLLHQHFDTAFAAPDGVVRLRELILTLAMQGKLVEQDPNDPPASELLREIGAEKQLLVKAGKIKKPKPLPPIKPDEVPYELPQGWEWVRLPECYFGVGNKSNQIQTKDYRESGKFPVVDQGKNFITGYYDDESKLLHIDRPVIVFGDHTKNIKFVDFDFIIGADGVKILCPFKGVSTKFLYHIIQSLDLTDRGYARHFKVLNEKLTPLPPLPEQHRIVARIDQLMARCDELEKLRKDREEKRLAVHAAAIQQLLDMPDGTAWDFIQRHFGELYTVKENVAELRKAILQLAVMGRLVPQDPNDPPASELLKEIEAEKQRLVKAKIIKSPRPVPSISQGDEPFQVPDNWRWVRISELAESIDYGTSQKTCDDSSLVPVYRMGNIVDGQLIDEGFKYIAPEIDELPRLFLQPNDILFNRTNSYDLVGKSARYTGRDEHATFASYLIRVRFFDALLNPVFISRAMNAPYFRSTQIEPEIVQQCGQANFNGTKLSLCAIPLPPLPEQHRIVARIDQLMALCDTLNQQIDAATGKQTELLNAVMGAV
ncbi:restriction endonuclease subunit S [Desulfonatronum thioautotrophicum]|uniref:restriction endonuclease subunit S n=1 Tax=Desulfonatronum thioautotrophicum TaxID=617001 RepID=UPI0005EBD934|nr:restriction endonuclease subunit S [Desulfonatronum thioautotrophicum]